MERHMWPLLYTWGCSGISSPTKVTIGESNGYLSLNLKQRLYFSPSYRVSGGPSTSMIHLKTQKFWIYYFKKFRESNLFKIHKALLRKLISRNIFHVSFRKITWNWLILNIQILKWNDFTKYSSSWSKISVVLNCVELLTWSYHCPQGFPYQLWCHPEEIQ